MSSNANVVLDVPDECKDVYRYDSPRAIDITEQPDLTVAFATGRFEGRRRVTTQDALLPRRIINPNGSNTVFGTMRSLGDIDGDGFRDQVLFCRNGTWAWLSDGPLPGFVFTRITNQFGSPQWGLAEPRRLADVNGDGVEDIIGFGYDRVIVGLSLGNGGIRHPVIVSIPDFTRKYGWHALTRFDIGEPIARRVADINGDGGADIVGFYRSGIVDVSLSTLDGRFTRARRVLTNFDLTINSVPHKWGRRSNERLLEDFDGDGFLDLVGIPNYYYLAGAGELPSNTPILVAYSNGDGTFRNPVVVDSEGNLIGDENDDGRNSGGDNDGIPIDWDIIGDIADTIEP